MPSKFYRNVYFLFVFYVLLEHCIRIETNEREMWRAVRDDNGTGHLGHDKDNQQHLNVTLLPRFEGQSVGMLQAANIVRELKVDQSSKKDTKVSHLWPF